MEQEKAVSRWSRTKSLGSFVALTLGAQTLGAKVTRRPANKLWYRLLRKPPQTPPDAVFGWVWPVLYALTAYSGYRTWQHRREQGAGGAWAFWGMQLAANASWSPLFFGKHRARWALGALGINFVSLAAYTWRASKVDRPAGWAMAPYLAWLAFAGTINLGVVRRNPRALAG